MLVDGRVVGRLERSNPRNLTLPAAARRGGDATLDILVEALGRVNFGCEWDFKGLTSPDVRLNGAARAPPSLLPPITNISQAAHVRQEVHHAAAFTHMTDALLVITDSKRLRSGCKKAERYASYITSLL